uniref:Genome polyprotein (Fragments) n=1 Tax=Simian hepatitis A virus TaxID=12101 RepID=Q7LZY8_9PICO
GLLNCNINNVVRIKFPFIYTRGAYHFKDPQYPVWELTIRVWSELNIGTGTSAYTSLNVLARFTDLELHGLTPLSTQMMRNEFRVSTTENVVNLSNYEDARAKMSFALDQEDWKSDPSQGGGVKITHFTTWTSIPTLAAQFAFNASASVGQQIKVIPVDPYFYAMDVTSQTGDDSGGFSTTVSTEQNAPDPQVGITTIKDLKGKANRGKMDVSGVQAPVGAITTIEDPVLAKKIPETFPELKPGESRHTSDHMSIYKFMGRSHFLCTFTFNANNREYTFPITLSSTSNPPHGLPSTLRWFFNLFQLYRGPLDLTIIITGATDVDGMAWFTPVGLAVDTPWVEKQSALTIDYKTALGAISFNTRRTGNIQIRLPWYSYLYAVSGAL